MPLKFIGSSIDQRFRVLNAEISQMSKEGKRPAEYGDTIAKWEKVVGNVIPNPTQGETMIPYVMNAPTDLKVSVYSLLGQQLMNFNQASEVGINYIKFDVSGWTPGMYIVAIEINGEQITRKVVVR